MPAGRPTLYRPEYCERIIELMADGLSFAACAGEIGVSRSAIYLWADEHPEFMDAKNIGEAKTQLWWEPGNIEAGALSVLAPFSSVRYRPGMPRDGALTLSDVRHTRLTIVCEPCGQTGNVERLRAEHGDAKMTILLQALADCPEARRVSIYD
jgi:hypothetical protein